ncbi:hypothetical protein [Haliscomenobacter hydrossis]|uniref:DISARM protein DrmE C-terminal domain-containing protein n=1 Tax=Haliscomenobacter hydrossis (strain ATCC 27775 / DSM 1100 / LMG 10767 / O) TaxID=760192 RepID=F4L858_HALH1|nr:hypothetical protein [Haliscomenobacter hydrossis]AEE54566.1 hypothetical protein Halhy_6752 [Haliscomenobacter hydrossis DSM 1100]
MNELLKYITDLKAKSSEHLTRAYNIDRFFLTDFELINFFLLDQAINNGQNLFIRVPQKNQENGIYLPTIISVAIALFFKNYCENSTSYKVGDILQKKGTRYRITAQSEGKFNLEYVHNGTKTLLEGVTTSVLNRDYIITNADYNSRKVKTKFIDYRTLFKEIFNTEKFPSSFTSKAVVIIEKKDFLDELKGQSFSSTIRLDKAIPYQWVNKNGNFETTPIPIDPMIYLVPDYETFKEFIFGADIQVDMVAVVGKNKYQSDTLRQIKRDLREEVIPFAMIIGNEPIEDEHGVFKKWNWTNSEVAILQNTQQAVTRVQSTPQDELQIAIENFESYIHKLNESYDISLPKFSGFKKLLYQLVMPSDKSRLRNQLEYIRYNIAKCYSEEIDSTLFNQGLGSIDEINELNTKVEKLFTGFSNSKLKLLNQVKFDFVVIPTNPKDAADIWAKESKVKTLNFLDFKRKIKSITKQKTFLFLSPFGYTLNLQDLYELMKSTNHHYILLGYAEEIEVFYCLEKRYENSLSLEFKSKERQSLSGIKFSHLEQPEEVHNLIDRIGTKSSEQEERYNLHENIQITNYQIGFDTGETQILESTKSVLVEKHEQSTRLKVSSLVPGDRVRIYLNLSKELLFETAKKLDSEGTLSTIERHSKLWKKGLSDHLQKKNSKNPEEGLLQELKREGISITSPVTLKSWLNPDSAVKFPQKQRDLMAIIKAIKNQQLEEEFSAICQSRRTYNGIMIALGRDLSDEVMDYIVFKKKGQMLNTFPESVIQSFVKASAPIRTIKTIQITENEEYG